MRIGENNPWLDCVIANIANESHMGLHHWTCAQLTPAQWGVCQDARPCLQSLFPCSSTLTLGCAFPRAQAGSSFWCASGGHASWHTRLRPLGHCCPHCADLAGRWFYQKAVQCKWHRTKNSQCFSRFTYSSHEVYGSNMVFLPWILINFTVIISCF